MKSRRLFITGGAGFIGSHLAEELSRQGHQVVVYDNLRTGSRMNLSGIPHEYIDGDVRDYALLLASMTGCDAVFHLAALTSVAESMENIDECIEINVQGTVNILKAARQNKLKKCVFASSAAVYGDSPVVPKTEDMIPQPKSPYAITKLDGEYYCELFRQYFGLSTVCARFFNVFGERQDPRSAYAAAIPIFMSNALRHEPVSVYGDGAQTRDFIYIKDIVKAMLFLMDNGEGSINIGYGKQITVNQLVTTIQAIFHSPAEVIHVAERPGEIRHSYASVLKLSSLGFQPLHTLDEGLQRTADYFISCQTKD